MYVKKEEEEEICMVDVIVYFIWNKSFVNCCMLLIILVYIK